MHKRTFSRSWSRHGLTAIAGLLLLTACGSDGDPASTTFDPPPEPGAKAIDEGEIQGFGSVVVNGTHYDTEDADIFVDGRSATEDELALGMIVRVEMDATELGRDRARARRILFHSALQGAIESIDSESSSMVVMGYTVATDDLTRFFDAAGERATLEDFSVDDIVRVSGFRRAQGGITATFVRAQPEGSSGQLVRGRISALDPDTLSFRLYGVPVDYSGATLIETRDRLENGDFVEVSGQRNDSGDGFQADRVTELRDRPDADDDNDDDGRPSHGSVQGVIGDIDDNTSCPELAFTVDGQPVRVTADTQYRNGSCSEIRIDRRIVAVGRFDDAGTLVALRLAFPPRINAVVRAQVEAIERGPSTMDAADRSGCTLRVLDDLYIHVDNQTRQGPPPSTARDRRRGFGCADVDEGEFVHAIGHFSNAGDRDTIMAKLLAPAGGPHGQDRRPERNITIVGGEVQSIDPLAQQFTVLGTAVQTDEQTEFRGSNGAEFYATTEPGDFAGALGEWTGSVVDAAQAARFGENCEENDCELEFDSGS